jgi:hypothetical protein
MDLFNMFHEGLSKMDIRVSILLFWTTPFKVDTLQRYMFKWVVMLVLFLSFIYKIR